MRNESFQHISSLNTLFKEIRDRMSEIKHKIIVLSGKGGVGKSFISSMLALALADLGYKVALLDADIHGSSIPVLLNMNNTRLYASDKGILPAPGPLNIGVIAINLMLPSPETPIVWRGPLKSKAIIELLAKVVWGKNDFLIIDLPPGTGDEAITIVQSIKDIDGAIIVTAPNILSEIVVAKAINFVVNNGVRLLGIVENMSYFKCPETGKIYYLLGKNTGRKLAEKYNSRLLAEIPFDPLIGEALDKKQIYYTTFPNGEAAKAIRKLASSIIELLNKPGNNN